VRLRKTHERPDEKPSPTTDTRVEPPAGPNDGSTSDSTTAETDGCTGVSSGAADATSMCTPASEKSTPFRLVSTACAPGERRGGVEMTAIECEMKAAALSLSCAPCTRTTSESDARKPGVGFRV